MLETPIQDRLVLTSFWADPFGAPTLLVIITAVFRNTSGSGRCTIQCTQRWSSSDFTEAGARRAYTGYANTSRSAWSRACQTGAVALK